MNDTEISHGLDQALVRAEAQLQIVSLLVAGHPADQVIIAVAARMQEQIQLMNTGNGNIHDFRLQVENRFKGNNGVPGNNYPGNGQQGTPVDGGTGNGFGGSGNKPNGTPGQNPPGKPDVNMTPQPGGGNQNKP
jgi:hypothetical protein